MFETSDKSLNACAKTLVARVAARMEAATRRGQTLRHLAAEAARELSGQFSVKRVWLFGSLAWAECHEHSDVDLLVEGLPSEQWSAACALVEGVVRASVDLVRVEEASAGLVERVEREGTLLHEAE